MSADFPRRRFFVLMGRCALRRRIQSSGVCAEAVKTVSVDGSAQLEPSCRTFRLPKAPSGMRVVDRSGKLVNEARVSSPFVVLALFFGIMRSLEAAGRVGWPDALAL